MNCSYKLCGRDNIQSIALVVQLRTAAHGGGISLLLPPILPRLLVILVVVLRVVHIVGYRLLVVVYAYGSYVL